MINTLPAIEYADVSSLTESREALLVTSKSADKAAGSFFKGVDFIDTIYVTDTTKQYANSIRLPDKKIAVIYALGGGRVMDVARFVGDKWGLEVIGIPTMFSSDAFLVDCSGLRENGCVQYVKNKPVSRLVIDFSLLSKTPYSYHAAGCGDILSIYTALHDWEKASQQAKNIGFDKTTAHIARGVLEALMAAEQDIATGSIAGMKSILTCLVSEVNLCNLYGNSRPEEGGEHFFAYALENKVPHNLHGEIVGLGILVTAFLQKQDWQRPKRFMDKVGINYRFPKVTRDIIMQTVADMPDYVKKHKLPFSIYNQLKPRNKELRSFLMELGFGD